MLQIAQHAGGSWPEQARRSAIYLSRAPYEPSVGVQLLAILRSMLTKNRTEITSEQVVQELLADPNSPWHEYRGRGPITKNQVAALLRDYDIRPASFIRLSELISRGTVTGQRTSTTRLRVSCPTSRTSEHSSAGATGCDVRMFGCLPLDGPQREGGLLAGLRTYLPLRRTTLTQQLFGPRPKFRRPYPSGIANSARHRRSPKGRARWTCGCWRTGSWSITYFILCRSSRDLPEDIAQIQSQRVHPARSAALQWAVSDVATVESVPDLATGKHEASLKIGKLGYFAGDCFSKIP